MIRFACILPAVLLLPDLTAEAAVVELPALSSPVVPGPVPDAMTDRLRGNNLFLLRNMGMGAGPAAGGAGHLSGVPEALNGPTLFDIDLFQLERPAPAGPLRP